MQTEIIQEVDNMKFDINEGRKKIIDEGQRLINNR